MLEQKCVASAAKSSGKSFATSQRTYFNFFRSQNIAICNLVCMRFEEHRWTGYYISCIAREANGNSSPCRKTLFVNTSVLSTRSPSRVSVIPSFVLSTCLRTTHPRMFMFPLTIPTYPPSISTRLSTLSPYAAPLRRMQRSFLGNLLACQFEGQ